MTITGHLDSGPVAIPIDRDVITVAGPDAERYLQGQLSQDIVGLVDGASAWSLLLQPQGKVDAWLRVTRVDGETFLLDLDRGAGEAALARLRRFLLRTRCDLALETWHTVAVRGVGVDVLAWPTGTDSPLRLPIHWPGVEGFDLLGQVVEVPPGLRVGSIEELDLLRIAAGVPAMGSELDERTIPAEAGIVERSVSFTKGCYTGQELVARIDSRGGNVPRRLRGLSSDIELRVGESLLVDGAAVGQITSAAFDGSGWLGLGYLKRAVEMPATLSVSAGNVLAHELAALH